MSPSERALIVGLGNPGKKYQKNRHNIGRRAIDTLAARHQLELKRQQSNALVADGHIAGRKVILARPLTYMNHSGGPIKALLNFYKLPPDNLIVAFDDLDLPLGTIRIRPEGGSSGQNGMRDIINQRGTRQFPRLRLGLSRPPGRMDPVSYVLRDFGKSERPLVEEMLERAADTLETWLSDGITLAMSRHNRPADTTDSST